MGRRGNDGRRKGKGLHLGQGTACLKPVCCWSGSWSTAGVLLGRSKLWMSSQEGSGIWAFFCAGGFFFFIFQVVFLCLEK